jgi:regulatory protein
MARITALKRNRGKVNIFLDGELAFNLSAALASAEGLKQDREITQEEVNTLLKRDRFQCGLDTAARYLTLRPRSDTEIRSKLRSHGYDTTTQNLVIEALKARGLLDDNAFAAFWTENRDSFSPRSRSLTRSELQKKGVAKEVIEKAVGVIDDAASAYRAAAGHVRSMRWSNQEQYRRRLGGYLERRGFSYSVINTTLKKVWKEVSSENISDTGDPDI